MANPIGSPVIQKTTESIAYTFDWSADGTPTAAVVTVVDRDTGASITLTGDPTINGDNVVTQTVTGLTEGHTYNMTCTATIGGVALTSICVIICTDGVSGGYQTTITMNDLILEVARLMGIVYDGTSTGGTTETLIDTNYRNEPDDYFNGGSVFILSGAEAGTIKTITDFINSSSTLHWSGAITTITSDIEYAVTTPQFSYSRIKAAINSILRYDPFLQNNDTLTTVADTLEYTLPVGVNNIKRVEIAASTVSPYYYTTYMNWKEWNGKIVFDNTAYPSSGYKIRLWYEAAHGPLEGAGVLRSSVDPEWVKWKAAAWLYRDLITRIEKDKPIDVDLLNEAKMKEDEMQKKALAMGLKVMNKDPKLAHW